MTDNVTTRLAALTERVTERPWRKDHVILDAAPNAQTWADEEYAWRAANNFEALVVALDAMIKPARTEEDYEAARASLEKALKP